MLEMADKPQNASSLQENNTRFFSNILTSVIILIGIHVVVTLTVIYVGERQTTEELRKELKDLKSQIGRDFSLSLRSSFLCASQRCFLLMSDKFSSV